MDERDECYAAAETALVRGDESGAVLWSSRAINLHIQLHQQQQHHDWLPNALATRATAHLHLKRPDRATNDAERALSLRPTHTRALVLASQARLHLGDAAQAASYAAAAEAVAAAEASEPRVDQLGKLSTAVLLEMRRRLESLVAAERKATERGDMVIEKGGLARHVEAAERAAIGRLASQARADAETLTRRVREICDAMGSPRWDYSEAVEQSAWLMREYPLHRQLRGIRLDALVQLGRFGEASALCEELLDLQPDEDELLAEELRICFAARGMDAALELAAEQGQRGIEDASRWDELVALLRTLERLHAETRSALDFGECARALSSCCAAATLSEGSAPTLLSLQLLRATALSRLGRLVEAVAACDDAGRLLDRASRSQPTEALATANERLLLRRAGCLLDLGRLEEAVADYRSAAALNPASAQAAHGLAHARALALEQDGPRQVAEEPYAVLGVQPQASATELRRAFHALCLRLHPDKVRRLPEVEQFAAQLDFERVQRAYNVMRARIEAATPS